MDVKETLDILMFGTACVFLLAGFPVAFTLAGTELYAGAAIEMGELHATEIALRGMQTGGPGAHCDYSARLQVTSCQASPRRPSAQQPS